jgi:hypothetical protein
MWLRERDLCVGVLAEGLYMFRLRAVATGWKMVPSGNLSFTKTTVVGWMSGSWTQKGWDSFVLMASATRGESFWLKPPWFGNAGCTPFELYSGICPSTEDNHGKPQSGSRVVGPYPLRRLFSSNLGWPAEHQSASVTRGWLQSVLGRHKCLPSCRTKGFPASAILKSKLSVSALTWSGKNGIPKCSWICLLPSFHGALFAVSYLVDVCLPVKPCIKGRSEVPCCFDSLYWLPEKLDWSGLLDGSRSLNRQHRSAFWDVGGNPPIP